MTFSLAGRCARSGQLGACVSTADIAVGSRVPFAEAGIGAVLTQHRTDPRLGPRALDLLRSGRTADETVDALVASTAHAAWRQLAVIDADGHTASFSGARMTTKAGEARGAQSIAIGNVLASEEVPAAMVEAFEDESERPLAERLLGALEAGLAAGGETEPVCSAALLVVDREQFPLVDLRVDLAPEPIAALRRLWESYRPWVDEFVVRALDPDRAGSGARLAEPTPGDADTDG
jgi:uncharacterized Ntn-hydrolase superfamily protein